MEVIARNKKAYFDYFVERELEVGICLEGKEVKSIRAGGCNLTGSWCSIEHGEVFLKGAHISDYQGSEKSATNLLVRSDPYRVRKLLLHKSEIRKLAAYKQLDGFTLIPLNLHFTGQNVKVTLGVCKGKKNYDKREVSKKRDVAREMRSVKVG